MRTCIAIIVIILILLCTWPFVRFVIVFGRMWWYMRPIRFNKEKCEKVFKAILEGAFIPNEKGQVFLDRSLASAAKHGIVYVTREVDGLVMVLFPMWLSRGTNMFGYLYCSRPLTTVEIHKDHVGRSIVHIFSYVAYSDWPPGRRLNVFVGEQESPTIYNVYENLP